MNQSWHKLYMSHNNYYCFSYCYNCLCDPFNVFFNSWKFLYKATPNQTGNAYF